MQQSKDECSFNDTKKYLDTFIIVDDDHDNDCTQFSVRAVNKSRYL